MSEPVSEFKKPVLRRRTLADGTIVERIEEGPADPPATPNLDWNCLGTQVQMSAAKVKLVQIKEGDETFVVFAFHNGDPFDSATRKCMAVLVKLSFADIVGAKIEPRLGNGNVLEMNPFPKDPLRSSP